MQLQSSTASWTRSNESGTRAGASQVFAEVAELRAKHECDDPCLACTPAKITAPNAFTVMWGVKSRTSVPVFTSSGISSTSGSGSPSGCK
jgi:hypothetical protein